MKGVSLAQRGAWGSGPQGCRFWGAQADGNSTGVSNPPGYCYAEQPPWSAVRDPSFGHGVLDVLNATHALWQCAPHQTLGLYVKGIVLWRAGCAQRHARPLAMCALHSRRVQILLGFRLGAMARWTC